jgi:hypothetical protein
VKYTRLPSSEAPWKSALARSGPASFVFARQSDGPGHFDRLCSTKASEHLMRKTGAVRFVFGRPWGLKAYGKVHLFSVRTDRVEGAFPKLTFEILFSAYLSLTFRLDQFPAVVDAHQFQRSRFATTAAIVLIHLSTGAYTLLQQRFDAKAPNYYMTEVHARRCKAG